VRHYSRSPSRPARHGSAADGARPPTCRDWGSCESKRAAEMSDAAAEHSILRIIRSVTFAAAISGQRRVPFVTAPNRRQPALPGRPSGRPSHPPALGACKRESGSLLQLGKGCAILSGRGLPWSPRRGSIVVRECVLWRPHWLKKEPHAKQAPAPSSRSK
jgi:hypothetical protein